MSTLETTADDPGVTVYVGPTEGGTLVSVFIALSDRLFDGSGGLDLRGKDIVTLTPDEARWRAEALERAALEADVNAA